MLFLTQHESELNLLFYVVINSYKFMSGRCLTGKWFVYVLHNLKDIKDHIIFKIVKSFFQLKVKVQRKHERITAPLVCIYNWSIIHFWTNYKVEVWSLVRD